MCHHEVHHLYDLSLLNDISFFPSFEMRMRSVNAKSFFCIYDFLCLSFTNTIFQSYNNTNKEQEKSTVIFKLK